MDKREIENKCCDLAWEIVNDYISFKYTEEKLATKYNICINDIRKVLQLNGFRNRKLEKEMLFTLCKDFIFLEKYIK